MPGGKVEGSGREVCAPERIHCSRSPISAGVSFFSRFGISPLRTFSISRLRSGFPATTAGPDSPPCTIKRLRRRSNPPLGFSVSPWQSKQLALRMGRISRSKTRRPDAAAAPQCPAEKNGRTSDVRTRAASRTGAVRSRLRLRATEAWQSTNKNGVGTWGRYSQVPRQASRFYKRFTSRALGFVDQIKTECSDHIARRIGECSGGFQREIAGVGQIL